MKAAIEQHLETPRQLIRRLNEEMSLDKDVTDIILSSIVVSQCQIVESIERYSVGKTQHFEMEERFPIQQAIRDITDYWKWRCMALHGTINTVFSKTLPQQITTSYLSLRNALNCLVSNGVMHAQGGQIRIEVSLDDHAKRLLVKVTNRGRRIPESKVDRLLGMDENDRNWDPISTSSLGIHQQVVRRCGGEISYKNRDNLN